MSGGLWQHMQQSLIPKVTAAQNLRLPVTKMLADFSGLADRIFFLLEVFRRLSMSGTFNLFMT